MNTVVAPLLDTPVMGYPYVTLLDELVQSELVGLQRRFEEKFGGRLWIPTMESLHVTFLHLLSPDVRYVESQDALYEQVGATADDVMRQLASEFGPVRFSSGEVVVSPAAIIVKWEDGGHMDRLREAFTNNFKVPEPTKRPPNIVHTTIGRFLEPMPVESVRKVAWKLKVTSLPTVAEIELVRESQIYLQEFDVLKRYSLKGRR